MFPKSRSAERTASAGDSPRSCRSRASISRWLRTSSSRSSSLRLNIALPRWIQHAGYTLNHLLPLGSLGSKLFLPGGCEPVVLGSLIVLRDCPFGGKPSLFREPVQGRVQGPRFYLEQ